MTDIAVPSQFAPLMTPIGDVQLDPKNARTHNERNLGAIAASLKQFGWRSVIVANKKTKVVLSGNGRLEAARSLKQAKVPVLFVNASDEQAAAYAISDNRSAELAEWDDEMLVAVLQDLESGSVDVGFSDAEMDALLASIDTDIETPSIEEPDARDTSKLPVNQADVDHEGLVAEKMPTSNVRLVQLFLDDTNIEEFNLAVRKLATRLNTDNVTDTVRKVVLAAIAQPD